MKTDSAKPMKRRVPTWIMAGLGILQANTRSEARAKFKARMSGSPRRLPLGAVVRRMD